MGVTRCHIKAIVQGSGCVGSLTGARCSGPTPPRYTQASQTVANVALGSKIIQLLGLDRLDEALEADFVQEIPIMQKQACTKDGRIVYQRVQAGRALETTRPYQPMHSIALGQQKFGQIGAILSRDPGNECALHVLLLPSNQWC